MTTSQDLSPAPSVDDAPAAPAAPRGTFRIADGTQVPFPEARALWSAEAFPALLDVARSYGAVITYKELGAIAQERTGVGTTSLLTNWIGKVLEDVALRCDAEDELLLTALCVRADGTVGPGYAEAVARHTDGQAPADADQHAAEVRLALYTKYAGDVPAGGGRAQLTPQEKARRVAAAPVPVAPTCAIHNTVLPASGQCDDCA